MSLKQIAQKIKLFYLIYIKRVVWLWIVVLSLINSYILGFLSNYNNDFNELSVFNDVNLIIKTNFTNKNFSEKGSIVASKNGTKYYFLHCSGVGRIKDENKIYFNSESDAIKEGYEKANGCK